MINEQNLEQISHLKKELGIKSNMLDSLMKQIKTSDRDLWRIAKNQVVLDNLTDIYLETSLDEKILYISESASPLLGYSQEEAIGKSTSDFFEDVNKRDKLISLLMRDGFVENFEAYLITNQGGRKYFSISSKLTYDENGEPFGAATTLKDISAIKNSIDELKTANKFLEKQTTLISEMAIQNELNRSELSLLLDNIDVQIWYLSDEWTYGAVNKAHIEFLSVNPEEIEHQPISNAPNWFSLILSNLSKEVYTAQERIVSEKWFKTDNNDDLYLNISLTPHFQFDNKIDSVVCIAQDLTKEKIAEQNKIEKEKLASVIEVSGATCHELNQPLQIISGYLSLIKIEVENDNKFQKKLEIIEKNFERMIQITEKLQNITRYETMDYLDGKIIDIHKSSEKLTKRERLNDVTEDISC